MSNISLTSSMRSNLLNLQQTTKLQQLTQNRLASGLKVNSAIDNPSSYYAAQSLNNRAEDLNVLLDAMSQGIQTLKAVNESIESGTKLLEQAKSVASSAMENTQPIAARVKTEAELLAAVNSGKKGLIVLDANITMSTNQNITLQDGQSLVGARYIDKNAAQTKLSFNYNAATVKTGIVAANNTLISDLDINYVTSARSIDATAVGIKIDNVSNVVINNINLKIDTSTATEIANFVGIAGFNSTYEIKGTTSIDIKGELTIGIRNDANATLNVRNNTRLNVITDGGSSHAASGGNYNFTDNAVINFKTLKNDSRGIRQGNQLNLSGNAKFNVETLGARSHGIDYTTINNAGQAQLNIYNSANSKGLTNVTYSSHGQSALTILSTGYNGEGIRDSTISTHDQSVLNIKTTGNSGDAISNCNSTFSDNSRINIHVVAENSTIFCYGVTNINDNVVLNAQADETLSYFLYSHLYSYLSNGVSVLNINSATAVINANIVKENFTGNDGATSQITAVAGAQINYHGGSFVNNTAITTPQDVPGDLPTSFDRTGNFTHQAITSPDKIDIDAEMQKISVDSAKNKTTKDNSGQFNQILAQYDSLIKDSSYKGVNLLQSQDLKVVFNEDRSSALDVKGVDASASGLGLNIADWNSTASVQASLDEIDVAINQLRQHASEFGNYYQIVTAREDFTNSLITVLTEGADDLTLADMNQESANMLALQTRQQLAVNSLSLASQASQSVLKLF